MSKYLACFTLLAAALAASAQTSPFYVRGDLGGALAQNTDLKEYFGPVAPGSQVKFDPGVRLGLTGGFQVTDWLGLEASSGVTANKINSITGATRLRDASYSNVPLQIGVRLQCPHPHRFSPYVGASVGGSISELDVDHLTINGTSIHGSGSDAVFAWQAFAGFRYALGHHMGLSVEYHYFAADGAEWRSHHVSGVPTDTLSFGGVDTHSLSVAFDYRF